MIYAFIYDKVSDVDKHFIIFADLIMNSSWEK